MDILKDRVTTFEQIDLHLGLEIDIRDCESELVVSHDPPTNKNLTLNNMLKSLSKNQLLAINIKSSEIEKQLKKVLYENNITNYFTFDWSIPSLLTANKDNLQTAFRLSEYENTIFHDCEWIWLDSFHKIWFDNSYLESLKNQNFKIALVSPELHGRNNELILFKNTVNFDLIDAICTDYPNYWLT